MSRLHCFHKPFTKDFGFDIKIGWMNVKIPRVRKAIYPYIRWDINVAANNSVAQKYPRPSCKTR